MCDDYFDDDYMDDIQVEEEFEDMDIMECDIPNGPDKSVEMEEVPVEKGISFEDFLFWGGYLGIMIDEEEEERQSIKKEERALYDPEDIYKEK
ncbi:MAG: hypothetical protein JW882_05790 [Deltaproteobacteria bacterium]|nr:hypothetical protein [Deltaproteobacteria bacterium]